jgi:hypothetical protein
MEAKSFSRPYPVFHFFATRQRPVMLLIGKLQGLGGAWGGVREIRPVCQHPMRLLSLKLLAGAGDRFAA